MRLALVLACLLACLLAFLAPAKAELDVAALEMQLKLIARDVGSGRLGVGVKDLGSGRAAFLNADEPFPMQSVYKAPIAAAVLRRVDQGELKLDQPITVTRDELGLSWSPLAREFKGERQSYALARLIELAVSLSDNSAADILMGLAGGPGEVTGFLREAGIRSLRVDRLEREIQPQSVGLGPFRPEWVEGRAFNAAIAALPEATRRKAAAAYLADPRDTASPRGTIAFLEALQAGRLLSPGSTETLLDVLERSPTGAKRLKAGLPKGTRLAHKTGTGRTVLGISLAVNDIGLATLPDGRRLAIAAFLAGSDRPEAERERIIAEVARAAVDALR